ncbi:MAG: glycerol-3-phosphate dehydrogenase subunit GlpB [Desulfobacterales bacterium]
MRQSGITCDLLVIGNGLAGMAAALFAAKRGISAAHAGMTGAINFSSGLLDLMGVYPVSEGKIWENPWDAIDALTQNMPLHPYARISKQEIRESLDEFMAFLQNNGLSYTGYPDRNARVLTPAGTVKPTFRVPLSMWKGVRAYEEKLPCVIADFRGLKAFSSRQIAETLKEQWPQLCSAHLTLPNLKADIYPLHLAQTLETPEMQEALIRELRPHIGNAKALGFPALLGVSKTAAIIAQLERELGIDVFEIPTIPPSVAGSRIRAAFEKGLPQLNLHAFCQKQVLAVQRLENGDFLFDLGHTEKETQVQAKAAILASGRFFGKGLHADRKKIRETIFDLPVFQPESRSQWHNPDFFAPDGHPVNQAGLETDDTFRPLGKDGKPVYENLFAAGSILAHQDWPRMKCGSGLAIATAFKAVKGFCAFLNTCTKNSCHFL